MPTLVLQSYQSSLDDIHQHQHTTPNQKTSNNTSGSKTSASIMSTNNLFPIVITLSEGIDTAIASNDILSGHHARKIIDTSKNNDEEESTIATFGKNYVLKKPDWLNTICQKYANDEVTEKTSDFNAILGFGDGPNLCVKVRKKCNHHGSNGATPSSTSKTNKKSSTKQQQPSSLPHVSFALGFFLDDGSDHPVDMLDPRDNFITTIQASRLEAASQRGPLRLIICPANTPCMKKVNLEQTGEDEESVVLFIDDDDLVTVLENDDEALTTVIKGSSVDDSDKKKRKKEKDPNAPSSMKTAYTYFITEYRSILKERNPDADFASISKLIGQKWRSMTDDEKAKYDALAAKDKVRYEKEKEEYLLNGGPAADDGQAKKKQKVPKDPNAPIAARNRYVLFCAEMRSKVKENDPSADGQGITAKLNSMYRALSNKELEKYDKLAEADKERYSTEMKAYEKGKSTAEEPEKVVSNDEEDEKEEVTTEEEEQEDEDTVQEAEDTVQEVEDDVNTEEDEREEKDDKADDSDEEEEEEPVPKTVQKSSSKRNKVEDEEDEEDESDDSEEEEPAPKTVRKSSSKRSTLQKRNSSKKAEEKEEKEAAPVKKSTSTRGRRASTRSRTKLQSPDGSSSSKKKKSKKSKKRKSSSRNV